MKNHDEIISIIQKSRHLVDDDAEICSALDGYVNHVSVYKGIRGSGDSRTFPMLLGARWPDRFYPLIEDRMQKLLNERAELERDLRALC
jgi:hypothetical protein